MKTSCPVIIIIDDDAADNYIARRVIKKLLPHTEIIIFTEAEKGLEYLKSAYTEPDAAQTVLLLDINMPAMTGWEFMENFEALDDKKKRLFTTYLLTSSDDELDKERALADKNITDYIVKPLTEQNILPVIFNRINMNHPNETSTP